MSPSFMSQLAYAQFTSEFDPEVKIPKHLEFWSLTFGTKYLGFCHSVDNVNKTRYVTRGQMEAGFVMLLNQLWPAFKDANPRKAADPKILRNAIALIAGGKNSGLETYWREKAAKHGKAAEEATYMVYLSDFASISVPTPTDFSVAGLGSTSVNIPDSFVGACEDELDEDEELPAEEPSTASKLFNITAGASASAPSASAMEGVVLPYRAKVEMGKTSFTIGGGRKIDEDYDDEEELEGCVDDAMEDGEGDIEMDG